MFNLKKTYVWSITLFWDILYNSSKLRSNL